MSEANKSVVRRYFEEVWNNKNLSLIDELAASTYVRLHERWSDWRACRRDLTPDQIAAWMQESWSLLPAYTVTYPADPVKAENTCARAAKTYVARHRGWFATAGQATAEGTTLVVGQEHVT